MLIIAGFDSVRQLRGWYNAGSEKMRKSKSIIQILAFLCMTITLLFCRPMRAFAKEANVSFGSESYSTRSNAEFPIGVYIRGESKIGVYYVEVQYDTERLEYIDGGDSEQDGVIILRGTGLRDRVKYMLNFRAIGGGNAGIRVRYAEVTEASEAGGEAFTVASLGTAPITIAGTDETGISFFERVAAEDAALQENETSEGENPEGGEPDNEGGNSEGENNESGNDENDPEAANRTSNLENWGIDSDLPILAAVDAGDGHLRYIVDHEKYIPDTAVWSCQPMQGTCLGRQVAFLTNRTGTVRILYLMDQIFMDGVLIAESFQPYAYSTENGLLYSCQETVSNGQTYFCMSAYACSEWPDELTLKAIIEEHIFLAMDMAGETGFYRFDQDNNLIPWNPDTSKATASAQTRNLIYILAAALAAIGLICGLTYRTMQKREKRQQRSKSGRIQKDDDIDSVTHGQKTVKSMDDYDLKVDEDGIIGYDLDLEEVPASYARKSVFAHTCADLPSPVISVQDVTMVFHISTSNASGIKEYLIQWIKRQVNFRELTALDHVSFDVFQGEVVGIIGTNGSGKSTLLKIVSGALRPSGGQVVVDRRKVQLLTLGTGFDLELSARENVYLNGSIIGYSREFLDAHYEEIVRFAELADFMEEKVKNFSSGMVSRLGFAIATAGDAAEILILDEVLSVGDEFFRKKSLKRIKEMIHGGSTVLMVSHSMGTILENCSKAVWIEKGRLRMVGEVKEVCGAYQKMNA